MEKAIENQNKIKDIKNRMLSGEISYEQAKIEAKPIVDIINAKSIEIAKKYNTKAKKISFTEIIR